LGYHYAPFEKEKEHLIENRVGKRNSPPRGAGWNETLGMRVAMLRLAEGLHPGPPAESAGEPMQVCIPILISEFGSPATGATTTKYPAPPF